MKVASQSHLLDTSYATYAKNHLSEFFPEQLVKFETFNTLDDFLIEVCQIAEAEYLTFMHEHITANLHRTNPEQFNTKHLCAIEVANNAIVEQLQSKLTVLNENN